ncbi:unnamed protein product [Pieris macdunnoughi]|uniref:Uncharacterized protein n=1 Tax=Pieris macdunnoughi TaxID=345717 RepID=A0A821XIT6_9NEOP|nr:unnamed protein product [Pieris macdunnoughi]
MFSIDFYGLQLEVKEKQKESTEQGGPSEEAAATKIQAVFRGHKTRKSISMKAVEKPAEKSQPEPSKAELEAEFRADDKVYLIFANGEECTSEETGLAYTYLAIILTNDHGTYLQ